MPEAELLEKPAETAPGRPSIAHYFMRWEHRPGGKALYGHPYEDTRRAATTDDENCVVCEDLAEGLNRAA